MAASLADGSFVRLAIGRPPAGSDDPPQRVTVRRVVLRGEPRLCFVLHHLRRDVTKNLPAAQAVAFAGELLDAGFGHAHLLTTREDIQWSLSRKGKPLLRRGRLPVADDAANGMAPDGSTDADRTAADDNAPAEGHDRIKQRPIDIRRPFLQALGVTDAEQRLVPSMARKWKQINRFVEIFAHAIDTAGLADAPQVRVLDFGSGKGYLTFAVHDFLAGLPARHAAVTGIELRDDLVALCEGAARRLGLDGLQFARGDVGSVAPAPHEVMIALHACDTATDHAIHHGVRGGAAVILCSPCCHKEIRPQMCCPELLRPMLQHGIHLGQQAEMVTDSLRALLLEAHGYETQVFEFVSLEHTQKNKMILAVRRPDNAGREAGREAALAQIAAIKAFYGIRSQRLEALLAGGCGAEPASRPG